MSRPTTPVRDNTSAGGGGAPPPSRAPLTPEHVRRIEINRLRAKALRDEREAEARRAGTTHASTFSPSSASSSRRDARSSNNNNSNQSNATSSTGSGAAATPAGAQGPGRGPGATGAAGFGAAGGGGGGALQPARKFAKYVDYDFSKMTDTKGGFLAAEDDPHNKAMMHASGGRGSAASAAALPATRPPHMTQQQWERQRLMNSLREARAGPFEPAINPGVKRGAGGDTARGPGGGAGGGGGGTEQIKMCCECESLEIDWKWDEVFGCQVCNKCKESLPDKYSLLTKTEVKEDYLLTDPELRDEELLPHLDRPNPHKATWNSMQLYLRAQVEAYAFSPRKWGSPAALDAEFARREADKKRRRERQFRSKLLDLKKRTRVDAYRRAREAAAAATAAVAAAAGDDEDGGGLGDEAGGGGGGGGEGGKGGGGRGGGRRAAAAAATAAAAAEFGMEIVGRNDGLKHTHHWGRAVTDAASGVSVKTCVSCGMEVEELEF